MAEDHFGKHVAERFDERYAHKAVPRVVDPIVAFIADLAGSGAALEFGVGTGRIALPLVARGVPVHGIDLSEAPFPHGHMLGAVGGNCHRAVLKTTRSGDILERWST